MKGMFQRKGLGARNASKLSVAIPFYVGQVSTRFRVEAENFAKLLSVAIPFLCRAGFKSNIENKNKKGRRLK